MVEDSVLLEDTTCTMSITFAGGQELSGREQASVAAERIEFFSGLRKSARGRVKRASRRSSAWSPCFNSQFLLDGAGREKRVGQHSPQ